MEDFSKPINPYRGRRGSYVPRTIFNPAADVLAGIEYVEEAFKERRDKVNLFQQQAEQRRIDMQKLVNDTQRIDQTDTMAKMTEQFSNMVTDIYKADIASFDGDRTDYLNKANNAQKVIGDFGKVIGVVDELSNKYLDMNPAEQKKMVLRNQFLGKDGDKRKAYMEFLNDPSKMNIRIQGGEIIITNNGKDLFNGTQLLNSVKAGNNLIEYADDYEKELTQASNEASSGLKSLVKASTIEKAAAGGTEITTEAKNDYIDAVNAYINNLEKSDKIEALINESNFQRFTESPDAYNYQKHGKLTKEKMIQYLVKNKFPMYDKVTGQAIGDVKITKDVGTPMSLGEKARLDFQKMKFTVDQIQTAKTEQELQRSIDFYLNRNLEHAANVSKMPKNSKQRADETVKLLNEARGIEKLGFKALQGVINENGEFEENSESGKYYVLDADGALVQGVSDNVGLVDALNQETVYKNLNMDKRSEIKPYVTNRMANFSKQINAIENKQPVEVVEKIKGEDTTIPTDPSEQVDYIIKLQDNKINNITLSDYNKYRNKIGLKTVNQNEFDITHKPGLIEQYRLGGNKGDYGSIIQAISNEIDTYVNKNAGKKDPKSVL